MNKVSTNIIIRTGLKFEALTLHTHKQYAALYNEYFLLITRPYHLMVMTLEMNSIVGENHIFRS